MILVVIPLLVVFNQASDASAAGHVEGPQS
jgi:hypothetical protein